ncbi:MAG: carbon starvation protein A [Sedimentisphaerales bacterium]|nr:carbon starvation protein A [Sedimentisphaerales bacterium]
MEALLLMVGCGAAYILAYHTYGRFLARRIFRLRADARVPSQEYRDGIDYVPTRKGIIFGHHFTSIAGTGPIVGPAIGILWGWLPAILWVVFGSILMGAVHDFGTLVVSLRNDGKSVSEVAARYINPRVRFLFFIVVFLALLIIIAIFGLVIASVFALYPESIIAIWLEIPIAIGLSYAIYKKNANVLVSTIIAVSLMYVAVGLGAWLEHVKPGMFSIPDLGKMPSTGTWTILLLIYAWVASTLPVTTLLQPRDYINAWQLFIMMALLVLGVAVSAFVHDGFALSAPAINTRLDASAPPLVPMMFVIIACGAISGFHSLVAGGTSPKQIAREPDAQFVGYGSMLTEGMLAVLVILCVTAGIGLGYNGLTGNEAWYARYGAWVGSRTLGDSLQPVVVGAANMMGSLGIPQGLGFAIMGVFISSFAGTTLDTAVRIQRYVVGELAEDLKIPVLGNRWTATTIAVVTAAFLAFTNTNEQGHLIFNAGGKGAQRLWPLFGTTNQLLAALALLVVTMYLKRKGGCKYLIAAVPCVIMLVLTSWAMVLELQSNYHAKKWPLVVVGGGVFLLAIWMTIETIAVFVTNKVYEGADQEGSDHGS